MKPRRHLNFTSVGMLMTLSSVSAPDLVKAVHAYHFPMSEPIFSWPLSEKPGVPPHIEWGGIARPTDNSAYRSVGEFWASALYNCLENEGIDEQFKTVGNASIFESVDLALTSRQLETLFPSVVSGLKTCYQSLRVGGLYGLVGIDARGLFALVWQEKHG